MSENFEILNQHLANFAELTSKDISNSQPFWRTRKIAKGDFFNMQNVVCNDLGLVVKGVFRIYYNDPVTSEEKNIFFFSENQFIVSFRSFITRYPCYYYIEAMEDSEIIVIAYHDLNSLYDSHPNWGKFGRLLAELFFNYSQARTEEFLFNSPEERYIKMLDEHPNIVNRIPAYHISSYLGITNPSLSRIRRRIRK
jgi:CRP-like cAMP-binding protein